MEIHLFDGTFELCRAYFGAPSLIGPNGYDIGATRSLLRHFHKFTTTTPNLYMAMAFDHVIESFRNKLFDGYKTGEGMDKELMLQFPLAEEVSRALGIVTWPMSKFEADDAMATASHQFSENPAVKKIYLCTPDKDLAQCVRKTRIIMWDRMRDKKYDEKGVIAKFGVPPESIADLLALNGDSADGIPGIPKWGMKSASTLLAKYKRIEDIPKDPETWTVKVRGATGLSENLNSMRKQALLYKKLAILRTDVPIKQSLPQLKWSGIDRKKMKSLCVKIGEMDFYDKINPDHFSH